MQSLVGMAFAISHSWEDLVETLNRRKQKGS
jgi:hypothetical protein